MNQEKIKRRIRKVTAFAAALMLVGAFSLPSGTEIMGVRLGNAIVASAATAGNFGEDDCLYWIYGSNKGALSISGRGAMPEWNSNSDVPWNNYCSKIKSVKIEEGATSIGKYAFLSCSSLTSITIPDSVTSIGDNAFSSCSRLTSITIPDSVTSIGYYTFSSCNKLESVTFGENSQLISIGGSAFRLCTSLKSITIPADVTSIGQYAFTHLTSIFLPEGANVASNAIPAAAAQVRYTVDGDNVTVTDIDMGRQTSLTIPDTIGGKTVTAVFIKDGTTGVDIPDSAAQVSYTVDNDGNVTVTDIDMGSQTSLTIPNTIDGKPVTAVYIENGTTGVDVPDSAAQVSYTVDNDGNVTITDVDMGSQTSLTIPNTIDGKTVTAVYVKEGTTGVDVPDTATRITYTVTDDKVTITRATAGTENISLTIPEKIGGKDVAAIGDSAFEGCTNLEKVTLPDSIISIGNCAFIRCSSLASINIPNGVTSIGENAFISCSSLGSITIPSSVTSIGTGALNCISSITVDDSNPNYSSKDSVLFNKDGTILIAYPINKSGDSYIIPDGVKSIEDAAFLACKSLTSITIPDSVTSIGDDAFLNCSSLTSITIPDSVISVGELAFMGCGSLESVFLPNDLSVINADIPASAAKVRYTVDADGNVTITSVELNNQTSVNFPDSIGGKPVASVCIKEGTTGVNIPDSLTQVSYTVDDEGNVTITEVSLGDGQTSFDIPDTIGGKPVDIADGVLEACPDVPHTHREKTAATCTEMAVCSICGQEYGEALGHDHSGDWQNDTADHWRVCERDDCTEILDKAAHDFDKGVVTTEPTEDAEGVKTYTCETCGHTKTEPVAKLDHTHSLLADYSFDVSGHWHACSGCDEKVDFEAHTMDSGTITTVPTETTEGVKTYKCLKCGNVIRTETIPPIPPLHSHEYGTEWTSDSTSHWHECECGEKSDVSEHISDGGRVFTEPTDTADGVMVYSCTVCGHFIDAETIPALTPEHTHEYGTEWKSDSAYHWHECECGEKSDVSEHISDGGKITVQPTANTTGVKTYSCTVCGYVIGTETVPKTGSANGHWYPIYPTFPTTSTNPGYTVSQSVFTEKLTVTTATDGDMVILSWSKIGNADKYYVYQYKNGKYVSIKSTANNSVSLKGLKNGESYQFLVRYVVDGKLSPTTYSSKFTVKVCYKPMPKATAEKNSIKLSWKAVPGAEKYAVYKYVDGKAVKLAEIKGTSVRINKLSPDTEYSYIVSAYVDGDWTAIYKSDVVTVKTEAE